MKRIIFAYFLLSIVAAQIFPIEGVGKYLFGSQPAEEVVHTCETDGKNTDENEELKKNELFFQKLMLGLSAILPAQQIQNWLNKDYASRLSDDTPTPPPLIFAAKL